MWRTSVWDRCAECSCNRCFRGTKIAREVWEKVRYRQSVPRATRKKQKRGIKNCLLMKKINKVSILGGSHKCFYKVKTGKVCEMNDLAEAEKEPADPGRLLT